MVASAMPIGRLALYLDQCAVGDPTPRCESRWRHMTKRQLLIGPPREAPTRVTAACDKTESQAAHWTLQAVEQIAKAVWRGLDGRTRPVRLAGALKFSSRAWQELVSSSTEKKDRPDRPA
jgi:hypothetical protein